MKTAKQRSLSKDNTKFELSWDDYLCLVNVLVTKIKLTKIKFDYVYGIPRGGLIPATIISHQLNIKLLDSLDLYLNIDYTNKKIIICDDICDTGKTLLSFYKAYSHMFKNWKMVTIFMHHNSPVVPDIFAETNYQWVQFPYEKD